MVFLLIKYTMLKVTLSTECFYLSNAMINLWRAKDVKVRINHCVFNILKIVSYLRHTKSSI